MTRASGLFNRYTRVAQLICAQQPSSSVVLLLDTIDGVDTYESFEPEHWDSEPVAEWDSFSIHPVICGGALSQAGIIALRSHLNENQIQELERALAHRRPDKILVIAMSPDDFHIEELDRS